MPGERPPLMFHRKRRQPRFALSASVEDKPRLSDLRPGEQGRVLEIGGSEVFRIRLMEMGLTSGETIEVDKFAPLQDPMELIVRNYHLSLRRQDAEKIAVERIL